MKSCYFYFWFDEALYEKSSIPNVYNEISDLDIYATKIAGKKNKITICKNVFMLAVTNN